MIALIDKYFPDLTRPQREQFEALYALYADWNAKINVISRKDFDQLYLRHVLHSLAIAKVVGWVWDKNDRGQKGALPNGILYLTGGDLADELSRTGMKWTEYPIPAFFDEAFFETKKVVYAAK